MHFPGPIFIFHIFWGTFKDGNLYKYNNICSLSSSGIVPNENEYLVLEQEMGPLYWDSDYIENLQICPGANQCQPTQIGSLGKIGYY